MFTEMPRVKDAAQTTACAGARVKRLVTDHEISSLSPAVDSIGSQGSHGIIRPLVVTILPIEVRARW